MERKQVIIAGAAVGGVLAIGYMLTRGGGGEMVAGDTTAVQSLANSVQNALERLSREWSEALASTREELAADVEGVRTQLETTESAFEAQYGSLFNRIVGAEESLSALEEELGQQYGAITSALTSAQQSIASLAAQASSASGAAATALQEAARARAETAWLTSVAVSGPNVTVAELQRMRDWLLNNTVKDLPPAQKQQWLAWVNSYIADWRSRGHGGWGDDARRVLAGVLSVGGGIIPASAIDEPSASLRPVPLRGRVDYGTM